MDADEYARRCLRHLAPAVEDDRERRWSAWLAMLRACRAIVPQYIGGDFDLKWHQRLYETYLRQHRESDADQERQRVENIYNRRAMWSALCAYFDAVTSDAADAAIARFLQMAGESPDQLQRFILQLNPIHDENGLPEYVHYCEVFGFKVLRY